LPGDRKIVIAVNHRSEQKSFSKLLGQVGQRLLPRIAVRATFALNAGL
jgi:hypothetical protein